MKLFKKWKLWKKFFRPDYDEMPEETEYDEEDWKKIDFDKKELNSAMAVIFEALAEIAAAMG